MTREELLMLFTDRHSNRFKTPFTFGNYIYATDAHAILFLPKQEGDNYTENGMIQRYLSMIENQKPPITYSLQGLKDLLGEKVIEPIYEEIKCEDCDGFGTVEFEYFSSTTRQTYESEQECPVCEGDGSKQGDKIGEEACYKSCIIKLQNAAFRSDIFKCIIDVCKFYSESVFQLVSESDKHKGHLFKVNEAYVLIMPFVAYDEEFDSKQEVKTLNPCPTT